MLGAYQGCWRAVEKTELNRPHLSHSEIHVMQVNPDHTEDAVVAVQLETWLNAFRRLLDRLREGMREW
jgi:hypothetical protein